MKNYQKLTVTVGIPVYNEVENVGYLLQSIIRQKQLSFKLEKIIVNNDGSTDGTDEKVKEKAKKNPLIVLLKNNNRKGKKKRLEEIYKMNKSDIIITYDGDVVLANPYVIEEMVGYFNDKRVGVVSGALEPITGGTFFGKLQATWFRVWLEARRNYKNGNNINNIRGCCLAMRSNLAKQIKFDREIVSDAQYIYFFALWKKLQFKFANNAVVLYRIPNNLRDFLTQKTRSSSGRRKLADKFGARVLSEYEIPFIYKLKAIMKTLIKNPIMTISAILFQICYMVFRRYIQTTYSKGLWKPAESTKKAITVVNF